MCCANGCCIRQITNWSLIIFFEEFAGDVAFLRGSEPEQMPHLVAVLNIVVSKATGREVEVENALVSYLRKPRFVHGNAHADGRIVLFFYFEMQIRGCSC
jgi:hypothetical protein